MKYYNYQWYNFNIVLTCDKCGGRIPMEELAGNPTCNDCGHVTTYNWIDVLKRFHFGELRKNVPHKSLSIGEINGNLSSTKVEEVGCYHCGKQVHLNEQVQLPIACPSCANDLHVTKLDYFLDILFYRELKHKATTMGSESMIAVRCAACGAPLKADPTKEHYTCDHCKVDNILPPAMRYKVVLNQMYAGVKYEVFPKQLAFEINDPEVVKKVFRNADKSKFTASELDQLIAKFPHDAGILNIVLTEFKITPSMDVLHKLWSESRTQQVFILTGPRINKSQIEIDERIRQFNPQYKMPNPLVQSTSKKSMNRMTYLVLVIVAVVILTLYFIFKGS